eukprot:s1364_g1.t1
MIRTAPGPRLHQPIRLLLTGRADGAPISDLVQLLELAQWEGGDAAGVRLNDRIALVRQIFSEPPFEAPRSTSGSGFTEAKKTVSSIAFVN